MKNILKIIIISLFALITLHTSGQEKIAITEEDYKNSSVEMADEFRKHGKIYVVVAVMTIILSGLLIYVYLTDKRLREMEKQQATLHEK